MNNNKNERKHTQGTGISYVVLGQSEHYGMLSLGCLLCEIVFEREPWKVNVIELP